MRENNNYLILKLPLYYNKRREKKYTENLPFKKTPRNYARE